MDTSASHSDLADHCPEETASLLRARFAALHVAEAESSRHASERWRRESEVLGHQINAMEETIGLLEREMKLAQGQLAKAERFEAAAKAAGGGGGGGSGGGGSGGGGGSSADIELLLGQLEDKLLRTQHDLEDARRAHYFPAASGFSLRFSYNDTYVGFKARLPLFPPPLLPPPPARARGSV